MTKQNESWLMKILTDVHTIPCKLKREPAHSAILDELIKMAEGKKGKQIGYHPQWECDKVYLDNEVKGRNAVLQELITEWKGMKL